MDKIIQQNRCYLIADEAGLGKTTIANEVINQAGNILNKKIHVIYIVSNSRIARKNMKEFMEYDPSSIKNFQKKVADRVIRSLYGNACKGETKKNCLEGQRMFFEKTEQKVKAVRLSMFSETDIYKNLGMDSYIISLTPKTSFLKEYYELTGTVEEKEYMQRELQKIAKLKTLDAVKSILQLALIYALFYELGDVEELPIERIKKKAEELEKDITGNFPMLRRIFGNANLLLVNPDLIILDEFQRFGDIIYDNIEGGYNIKVMLDFIKWYNGKKEDLQGAVASINEIGVKYVSVSPKFLLLSATPYKFDKEALETVWEAELNKSESEKSSRKENPFENWAALCDMMKILGANIEGPEISFVERTQRNFFWRDNEAFWKKQNQVVDTDTYRKHIEYLSNHFRHFKSDIQAEVIQHDENIKWVQCAPEYWRFTKGYKGFEEDVGEKYCSDSISKALTNHMLLNTLLKKSMPDGAELLLWVPPIKNKGLKGPFDEFKDFGKTLVFAYYRMSAKSAAALVSENVEQRLQDMKDMLSDLSENLKLLKNESDALNKALVKFFNSQYVKNVVSKAYRKYNGEVSVENYEGMVKWYIDCGDLQSAMQEYKACCRKYDESVLIELITMELGTYDQEYRFNSPFYPFIMTVTATAQEGIDFHKYADKIMHWTPALNANAFQQREGRIDRMGSLVLRRRFFELCGSEKWSKDMCPRCFFEMMNSSDNSIREVFFNCITDEEVRNNTTAAMEAELFPMWYIPKLSENSAVMERIIACTYFSKENDAFHKLLEASKKYSNFAGEEPEKLCACLCNSN